MLIYIRARVRFEVKYISWSVESRVSWNCMKQDIWSSRSIWVTCKESCLVEYFVLRYNSRAREVYVQRHCNTKLIAKPRTAQCHKLPMHGTQWVENVKVLQLKQWYIMCWARCGVCALWLAYGENERDIVSDPRKRKGNIVFVKKVTTRWR